MLQTQVIYWQNREQARHNLVAEEQARNQLAEEVKHNRLTENLGFRNYAETAKHNRMTESQQQQSINLGYRNLSEEIRSHKANEGIQWANAKTNRLNAHTNAFNARTQAMKVGYDNINTQYANRTARFNAYNNEANTAVRREELLQTKRRNDIMEAGVPAQYLNLLPTPKIDVVRKVTKTKVKPIKPNK